MKKALLVMMLIAGWAWMARAETTAAPIPPDWKTYTNTQYGFSFQYPPRFQVKERIKLKQKTVFSTRINSGLYTTVLYLKGAYAGFSVVVEKKGAFYFRTKTLPGFYKFEPSLNAWLGYNPISTEYGTPAKTYFYLGSPLCAQVETFGSANTPTYGTSHMVGKSDPRNDFILTDQAYGFEIPREEPAADSGIDEDLAEIQEQIRGSFTVIKPAAALKADCDPAALHVSSGTLPTLIEPKHIQTILCGKKPAAAFDKPLPAGYGAVFYLSTLEDADPDKIVFETLVGDLTQGARAALDCENVPLNESGDTSLSLYAYFYKKINGRKVLLGREASEKMKVLVK